MIPSEIISHSCGQPISMNGRSLNNPSTDVLATELENPDNSSDSCYMFSATQIQEITTVTITMYSAGALTCFLGIVVIVALRQYRTFVHRLLVYLMVTAFVHGISAGLEVAPVHHNGRVVEDRHGLNGVCRAIGFVGQVTESQFLLVCTWILVYLVLLVVFQYRLNSKRHEIAGLVISLGLPLTLSWLPYIHNMYGLAGPWCWIRTTNKDCRDHIKVGVIYQFTLFYGPQALLIVFGFMSFLVIVTTIGKRSLDHSGYIFRSQHSPYQQALKESLPLLVYPVIYNILAGVMVANRIYYAITTAHGKKPFYPLWLAHTIAEPLRILFIPLAYLLHPGTISILLARRRTNTGGSDDSETNYPVPQEPSYSEVDPLVIRGSVDRHGSNYKSIFESSDARMHSVK